MVDTPTPTKSRMAVGKPTSIPADNPTEIQRGYHKRPFFFGDVSLGGAFGAFVDAVDTASNYSGWTTNYTSRMTPAQYNKLTKVASDISTNFPIGFEAIRDFLTILCCISSAEDMRKIAEAVELESLQDPRIVGNSDLILEIADLYKVAFMANAVDGILKLFSRFLDAQNNNSQASSDFGDIIKAFGVGISAAGAAMRIASPDSKDTLGQYLSELLTGQRIPMTVLAKNPNLQIPSYIGKAFLGEAATALPLMDIKQTFAKKIAAFPQMGNGSASTMFSMINSKSLGGALSIEDVVGRVMFGSGAVSQAVTKAVDSAVSTLNTLTGVRVGELIQINKADTAIPLLTALSAVQSGQQAIVIPHSVFQAGWSTANYLSQFLAKNDPNYLNSFRSLT